MVQEAPAAGSGAPGGAGMRCAGLLAHLRSRRIYVGVDQQLDLEYVLSQLDEPYDPRQLKALVGPLVAKSPTEQRRFSAAFDEYFPSAPSEPVDDGGGPSRRSGATRPGPAPPGSEADDEDEWASATRRRRRWWAIAVAAATLAVLLTVLVVIRERGDSTTADSVNTNPGSVNTGPINAADDSNPPVPLDLGVPTDPLLLAPSAVPSSPGPARPAPWYRAPGVRESLAALPLLLLLIALLRRAAAQGRYWPGGHTGPPYTWSPRPATRRKRPFAGESFLATARAVRRRERAEGVRLSVEQSVTATIRAGGFPTLRFEPVTRTPEYLVLIERASARDHQARFYAGLSARLREEGVDVEYAFYEGDPRTCFRADAARSWATDGSPPGLALADLLHRHQRSRLFMCGDGQGLLDPETGALLPWTRVFEDVPRRALLTPEAPAAWSGRETRLADRFLVLPGSFEGLRAAIGHFESGTRPDAKWWREHSPEPALPPLGRGSDMHVLRLFLGPDVFRWLCGCAVYRELHWELTLQIGARLQRGREPLITEGRIRQLARLPWFREGVIPAPAREELLARLSEEDEEVARRVILRALRRGAAPAGSAAALRQRVDRAVQQLFLDREEPTARRRAVRDMARLPHAAVAQDAVAMGLLRDLDRGRRAARLPDRLRRALYPRGMPALGTKAWARGTAAGTASVAMYFAFALLPDAPLTPPTAASSVRLSLLSAGPEPGDSLRILAWVLNREGQELTDRGLRWTRVPDGTGATAVVASPSGALPGSYLYGITPGDTSHSLLAASDSASNSASGHIYLSVPRRPLRPQRLRRVVLAPRRLSVGQSVRLDPRVALHRLAGGSTDGLATAWQSCVPGLLEVSAGGVATALRSGRASVVARTGPWIEYGEVWIREADTPDSVPPLGAGPRLFERVHFPRDTVLAASATQLLDEKARLLRADSSLRLRLIGYVTEVERAAPHDDSSWSSPRDSALGYARARLVHDLLVQRGVPAVHLSVESAGATCPSPEYLAYLTAPTGSPDDQRGGVTFAEDRGARRATESAPVPRDTQPDDTESPILRAGETMLRILATNDFHGALESRSDARGTRLGGAGAMATALERAAAECRASGCQTLLVDGGDMLQGTPASNLLYGRPVVELFNALGYAAAAVGNHEFDWGLDTLRARMRDARFRILGANIGYADGRDVDWIPDDTIVTRGPLRVGIVGVAAVATPMTTRSSNVAGLRFDSPAAVVADRAQRLRGRGADVVVVIAHEGALGCTPDDQARCAGEVVNLAAALPERVGAIVSGHTHSYIDTTVRGIPIVQARSSGRAIGVIDLAVTRATRRARVMRVEVRDVLTDSLPPSPSADSIARRALAVMNSRVNVRVAEFAESMPRPATGSQVALGNFVADAQRSSGKGDIAVVNDASLRAEIRAGPATYRSLFEVQPFGNALVRVTVRGSILRGYLERLVARGSPRAHVSGVAIGYDSSAAPGSRVVVVRLDGGRDLQDDRTYSIIMNDFLASGGDNLGFGTDAISSERLNVTDLDALVEYARTFSGPIPPPAERRIYQVGKAAR